MTESSWKIPYSRPDIPEALVSAGYPPLLAAALRLRGITTPESAEVFVHGGPDCIPDPLLIKGMAAARDRVLRAIEDHESAAVYGDYDVDGITATCLLTDYLQWKGLHCLSYIPDRAEEGYGLNTSAIDTLKAQGVSLIITVDCGITAAGETAYAASVGIDMVITDHHECKDGELPNAAAVIDCKQDGDTYPNKDLAGVGVALKLVCACEGSREDMVERYADLVAIGTIADVMPLSRENRYLVQKGLKKLEESPRPGIAALMRESGVADRRLSASTIGFTLAPRLNATGRLGHAETAVRLLMCDDPAVASQLAVELCELNRKRQTIENEIWQEANALLAGTVPHSPIVLASDKWHQGVIGIAASRLSEQYSLPAIMICLNGDVGKGSCRSYGGFNLFDALSACSEHLIGFGGHALAAGLNIRSDKLDVFREALRDYYSQNRPHEVPVVQCDMLISDPAILSMENVDSLDLLEPYGSGNPKPVLCMSGVELEALSAVGGGKHLRIKVSLRSQHFEGIFFSHTSQELGLREGDRVDVAFTPQINEFRGHRSVQLLVTALRRHESQSLCREILDGSDDIIWACAQYCPDRADFVRVWRMLERRAEPVSNDPEGVLSLCPGGMEAERFCLCLMAFLEAGLLAPGTDGGIFGSYIASISGKADLEATSLIRKLKTI